MPLLEGRTALVTGSSSGIGRAIALAFAEAGADIASDYVGSAEAEDEAAERIRKTGRRVVEIEADISKADEVQNMVNRAMAEFGKIDILVNNAGLQIEKAFRDLEPEDWDRMLSVDLRGTFLVTLYTVREMIKSGGGKIINITSVHQLIPKPNFAPYCAAKAGVGMLTKTLAVDLAPYKIRVNAIAPGAIATPMNKDVLEDPEKLKRVLDQVPAGRMGTAEEVAQLALYLASDAADYVTGATFVIDGGLTQQVVRY